MKETLEFLEHLKKSFSYDPLSGIFTNINPKGRRYFGKIAGTKRKDGYIRLGITFEGKFVGFLAHRVAWAFYYGVWPSHYIDHKDKNKANNAIYNLRDVEKSVNAYNYSRNKKNKTGYRGVSIDTRNENVVYNARYSTKHLGTFYSAEEASDCYREHVKTLHDIIVED